MLIDTRDIVIRERPDPSKVQRYQKLLQGGSQPPPVAVMPYDQKRWLLLDGHHRLYAARAEGYSHITAVTLSSSGLM